MKWKARATRMVIATRMNAGSMESLGALEHDLLEDVGDVFGFVGRVFQHFVEFLELDQRDGVALVGEEIGNGAASDAVRFVLQAINLDAIPDDIVMTVECGDGV